MFLMQAYAKNSGYISLFRYKLNISAENDGEKDRNEQRFAFVTQKTQKNTKKIQNKPTYYTSSCVFYQFVCVNTRTQLLKFRLYMQ